MKKAILLNDNVFMGNTYVVGDETRAIVIDPACEVTIIVKALKKRTLLGVFLTHAHYDHFRTLRELLDKYPEVKCYLHKLAYYKLDDPNKHHGLYYGGAARNRFDPDRTQFIHDKDLLTMADGFEVGVLETPGHTDCSVSLIIDDMLFSGDTLFKNTVGRSDLPTGDQFQLTKSVNRLLALDGNLWVYPGHDEATTLEEERNGNPFAKISKR